MNMTSEQIRPQQFAPGKGDTQRIDLSSPPRNADIPVATIPSVTRNTTIPVRNGQCGGSYTKTSPSPENPLHDLIQTPRHPAKGLEFWLDPCRGFAPLKFACAQIQELYRKHGCRFAEPTPEQIRGILSALDGA